MAKRQRYCSKSCAQVMRRRSVPREVQTDWGRKGGKAAGLRRHAAFIARLESLVAEVGAVEACRQCYSRGYRAGHRARRYYEVGDGIRAARSAA